MDGPERRAGRGGRLSRGFDKSQVAPQALPSPLAGVVDHGRDSALPVSSLLGGLAGRRGSSRERLDLRSPTTHARKEDPDEVPENDEQKVQWGCNEQFSRNV